MAEKTLYRVSFLNQGEVFEVFVRSISHGELLGFVELAGFVFGERTTVVVDPSEERLQALFAGVSRTYVPVHQVIRIDQVDQRGKARISPANGESNVSPFPVFTAKEPKT